MDHKVVGCVEFTPKSPLAIAPTCFTPDVILKPIEHPGAGGGGVGGGGFGGGVGGGDGAGLLHLQILEYWVLEYPTLVHVVAGI